MILFIFAYSLNSEELIRNDIRGVVIDKQSQQPLSGALIKIFSLKKGIATNTNGEFVMKDIPVGRHSVVASYISYKSMSTNIVLSSGKSPYLKFELEQAYSETEKVVVTANKNSFTPLNESAIVSSTQFTIDDVQRFAGSRMDPAKMAQNYAGVVGASDERNDIIIRGGSPTELLWRIDGMDIPNPNHFATQGATGGPISAINTNYLDNSDFLTGAFPSEYGDKLSGVFDLRTRKGNDEEFEYLGQFGFNGFEFGVEGPLHENSSFILNYRYSFLDFLVNTIGVDFSFSGVPEYQDLTMKYDWDIDENNFISLTGLYGKSHIEIKTSEDIDTLYNGDEDIVFGTNLYVLALNWKHLFNKHWYSKMTLGFTNSTFRTDLNLLNADTNFRLVSSDVFMRNKDSEGFITAKYNVNYSPNNRHFYTFGGEYRHKVFSFDDQYHDVVFKSQFPNMEDDTLNAESNLYINEKTFQTFLFANWNWKINEKLTSNIGLHSQYIDISGDITFEPRFGLKYELNDYNKFNMGIGLHNQSLPLLLYYTLPENKDLKPMQSLHYVLGYSLYPEQNWQIKTEFFLKDYSNIAIEDTLNSQVSLSNMGSAYGGIRVNDLKAVSGGKALTYGGELSITKNFSEGYYLTMTTSYIRQKYATNIKDENGDLEYKFGAFDNGIIFNVLAGYEWEIDESNTLEFSGKFAYAGGVPYTSIDLEKSFEKHRQINNEVMFDRRNSDYMKIDIRIDWRQNFEGFSMVSYFSIENLLDTKNESFRRYDPIRNTERVTYQMGFFPVGGFKVEF